MGRNAPSLQKEIVWARMESNHGIDFMTSSTKVDQICGLAWKATSGIDFITFEERVPSLAWHKSRVDSDGVEPSSGLYKSPVLTDERRILVERIISEGRLFYSSMRTCFLPGSVT